MDTRLCMNIQIYQFVSKFLIPDKIILNNPGFTIEQLARLTGFEEKLIRFKAYNKQKNEREHYGF